MSAAKDEAENGQLDFESEEGDTGQKDLEEDENQQVEEDDVPPPRLGQLNGDDESESTVVNNTNLRHNGEHMEELASDEQGSIQATRPALGRPSSADGSLSIPDDTPSVQVWLLRVLALSILSDSVRAREHHLHRAEASVYPAMAQVRLPL